MRTVKDIVRTKHAPANFVQPTTLVIEALRLLETVNLSYLIVMDGDQYKGIFGERDYTRNVILKGRSSSDTMVQQVMTTDLPVVGLNDSVEFCMSTMNTHKTRYLLALDERHRFAGIVTIHDLLRQVLANKEEVFDHSLATKLLDNDENVRIY